MCCVAQLCPTLRDPRDCSPSARGISQAYSQAKIPEWVAISFSSVLLVFLHLLSHVQLFATPWTAACQAALSFTISRSLLKLMSIESVMPSTHLVLCHPLLVLPSIFPSISILLTCMEKSLTIYLCCTIYILTFQRNTVEFHIEHKELALLHLKYKSFIELPRVTQFFNLGVGWGWGF